jgi:hypothetical protein
MGRPKQYGAIMSQSSLDDCTRALSNYPPTPAQNEWLERAFAQLRRDRDAVGNLTQRAGVR